MAKITNVVLIDDIDHVSEATVTHALSLDGHSVRVDLTDEHSRDLVEAVRPFLEAGTAVSPAKSRRQAPRDGQAREIRAWANENGLMLRRAGGFRRRFARLSPPLDGD